MKFDVRASAQGLKIDADATPAQARKMMDEFAKCANGTCSCQTPEYEKLESMQVHETETGLTLDLKAKPGQSLDWSRIEACLDHTAEQIGRGEQEARR